jgi:transglutaminase-like putative cysteine protease
VSTTFIERVRRANAPPPADDSILFRVTTTVAVLTGIAASESVGEVSFGLAAVAMAAICGGMLFSYLTRHRPWQWLKVILALVVIAVFAIFVNEIFGAAQTGQLASIEVPLAGLFTWVQVVHAFDVPARRDLLFSLAAGGALVTIAGAQASSPAFVAYVALWLVATVVGLGCSWQSMVGDRRTPSPASMASCLAFVLCVALALLVVLPQPRAARGLTLPSALSSYLQLGNPPGSGPGGQHQSEPAQPGEPGGHVGVSGYVGFGGTFNTADRGSLGNTVIMRVRAERPGYFLGMTYDTWSGQSWSHSSLDRRFRTLHGRSPFTVPVTGLGGGVATPDVQTFYVQQPLPNLLFSTAQPAQVYISAKSLLLGNDGELRSAAPITPGTVYTVISDDGEVSPARLAADRSPLPPGIAGSPELRNALQLPHPYPRVQRLARSIVRTAHATSTEAVVAALEAWMGAHTRYSTAIPPLGAGRDAVDEFLFGNRLGYCEQISTSLAVMLRTLGIPAREAVGYVPGPFDPFSGLYEIQAKDAHAWVQVYFPGYGWQSFDPTADVPLAPENPGTVLLHDLWGYVGRLPWAPIGFAGGAVLLAYGGVTVTRRRRRRPTEWAGVMAMRIERIGKRAGLPREPTETLDEYAARLGRALDSADLTRVAALLERHAYQSATVARAGTPEAEERSSVAAVLHELSGRVGRSPGRLVHSKRRIASS